MDKILNIDELLSEIEKFSNSSFVDLKLNNQFDDIDRINDLYLNSVSKNGKMLSSVEQEKAFEIYKSFYSKVLSLGYQIFLTNMNLQLTKENYYKTYYDLAIIKSLDTFDILRLINTEAVNYDHTTENIIEKLKSWEKYSKLQIVVVDYDRVEAFLLSKPKNVKKFSDEVYYFAPDVVEQGTQTKRELIKGLNNGYLWLWWD